MSIAMERDSSKAGMLLGLSVSDVKTTIDESRATDARWLTSMSNETFDVFWWALKAH